MRTSRRWLEAEIRRLSTRIRQRQNEVRDARSTLASSAPRRDKARAREVLAHMPTRIDFDRAELMARQFELESLGEACWATTGSAGGLKGGVA